MERTSKNCWKCETRTSWNRGQLQTSVGRERERNKWSDITFGKPLQGEGIEQCTLKMFHMTLNDNTTLWRDWFYSSCESDFFKNQLNKEMTVKDF